MTYNTTTDDFKRAYDYCISLLARREYARRELSNKLKSLDFQQNIIELCLTDLITHNYQSDQRYAEMLIRTRVNQRYGSKKIIFELNRNNIDAKLYSDTLLSYAPAILDNAKQLIVKKAPKNDVNALFMQRAAKDKVLRFLLSKGYEYDTINLAFEIIKEESYI